MQHFCDLPGRKKRRELAGARGAPCRCGYGHRSCPSEGITAAAVRHRSEAGALKTARVRERGPREAAQGASRRPPSDSARCARAFHIPTSVWVSPAAVATGMPLCDTAHTPAFRRRKLRRPRKSCRFVAHYGCAFRRRNPVSPATYQVGFYQHVDSRRAVRAREGGREPAKSSIERRSRPLEPRRGIPESATIDTKRQRKAQRPSAASTRSADRPLVLTLNPRGIPRCSRRLSCSRQPWHRSCSLSTPAATRPLAEGDGPMHIMPAAGRLVAERATLPAASTSHCLTQGWRHWAGREPAVRPRL
jgi:hypothetical protein